MDTEFEDGQPAEHYRWNVVSAGGPKLSSLPKTRGPQCSPPHTAHIFTISNGDSFPELPLVPAAASLGGRTSWMRHIKLPYKLDHVSAWTYGSFDSLDSMFLISFDQERGHDSVALAGEDV